MICDSLGHVPQGDKAVVRSFFLMFNQNNQMARKWMEWGKAEGIRIAWFGEARVDSNIQSLTYKCLNLLEGRRR